MGLLVMIKRRINISIYLSHMLTLVSNSYK